MGKCIDRGGNRIIKRSLGCIRTWRSINSFRATTEGTGRLRTARTPIFEEGKLHAVELNLDTGARALAVATERSRTTVYRLLQDETLHRFHDSAVIATTPTKHHVCI